MAKKNLQVFCKLSSVATKARNTNWEDSLGENHKQFLQELLK